MLRAIISTVIALELSVLALDEGIAEPNSFAESYSLAMRERPIDETILCISDEQYLADRIQAIFLPMEQDEVGSRVLLQKERSQYQTDPSQEQGYLKISYGWIPRTNIGIMLDVRGLDDYARCKFVHTCGMATYIHLKSLGAALRWKF